MATTPLDTPETTPRIFYEGTFSSRSWPGLAATLTSLALAVGPTIPAIYQLTRRSPNPWGLAEWLFIGAFCAFFWSMAALMAYRYLTAATFPLRIDTAGITFGRSHWPWARVRRLTFHYHRGLHLRFNTRGWWFFDRDLPADTPLTLEQYNLLIARLKRHVGRQHPHIRFV